MKKTLLSVLAGLTVMGSAIAVPDPGDREELCKLLIEKGTHVWVEKTEACIPVNPCLSDEENIRNAYCISIPGMEQNGIALEDERQVKTFLDRFAEKVLKTDVLDDIKYLDNGGVAVKTDDDGYYAFQQVKASTCETQARTAALAYGREMTEVKKDSGFTYVITKISEQDCTDIKDFENLLYVKTDTKVDYSDKKDGSCSFYCNQTKK